MGVIVNKQRHFVDEKEESVGGEFFLPLLPFFLSSAVWLIK